MATLTLKNFPDDLLARVGQERPTDLDRATLRELARRVHEAAQPLKQTEEQGLRHARDQADAWERLAGRWKSNLPVGQEIEAIFRARTAGRETCL